MVTDTPTTLREAILYFGDSTNCRTAVEAIRWPDGVVRCPHCHSDSVIYLDNARVWKCRKNHPRAKFSLKVGTIFEDSAIGFEKWFPALWLVTNCRNGISSYELGRVLGVTQKTAWFMLWRLRPAAHAQDGTPSRNGEVVDVPADDPAAAMDRFTAGLYQVLSVRKTQGRGVDGRYRNGQDFDPSANSGAPALNLPQ